jgi:hypothetical protein
MAEQFKNVDPLKVAQDAERDLNSTAAKQGHAGSDSSTFLSTPFHISHRSFLFPPHFQNLQLMPSTATDSGIDESVTAKFPGSTVEYGSGASNNRTIPESEGGSTNPATGKPFKAGDYAKGGVGAPEARDEAYAKNHGGEDNVGNAVDGASLRQSGAK